MAAPVPGTPAWYRSRATPIPKPQPSSPKTPLVTAKKTDPATVFGTPQWVDARVSEQIDPQVQAIQDALKAQQAQNANYQSALTGYYKALGGVLQNEAPAVSAAYNSAAQGIGQVAQGYTQGLAQQYQNEAQTVQAALERAGQQQAIPSSVALANPGTDPFYAMHGAIPASTLAQQGAAAATDAAAQPRIWAARGADALTVAVQKAMEGDQAMQSKIADIYASVPAVRQKIEDSVRQYQLDAQKLKVDQQQAQQKLALDQYKADTSYDAKIRAINASIAKNNAALQQKNLDRQTRIALANQNADLARQRIAIQQQKLAASGTGSDVSPSQNNAALNAAQKAAHSALDATAARIWAGVPNSNLDPNSDDPKVRAKLEAATAEFQRRMDMNFGTAMARTINAIGPYLKKIGYSSAQIKAQAYKYVTTGFTSGDGTLTRFQPPKGYKVPTAPTAKPASFKSTYTGGGGTALVSLLQQAGFSGEALKIAYGIAMRESGGRPEAFNGNTGTGDRSWGLFQINTLGSMKSRVKQFGLRSEQDLLDPLANAKAAYQMSKGGTDFGAWGIGPNAYRSGAGFDTIARYYNQFPGNA